MWEYQNAKDYNPNWSEEMFMIKIIIKTVPWSYVITDLNSEEIFKNFMKKGCNKCVKQSSGLKKLEEE